MHQVHPDVGLLVGRPDRMLGTIVYICAGASVPGLAVLDERGTGIILTP